MSTNFFIYSTVEGMTETSSSLTFMTLYDPILATPGQLWPISGDAQSQSFLQKNGVCVGKPAPHVELRICVDGSSNVGKILTRGPHVMLGYWDHTQSRACNPSNEVWFDTGDVGSIDEKGNLWLVGRANGRIKSGGENVYPEEVSIMYLCLLHCISWKEIYLHFLFVNDGAGGESLITTSWIKQCCCSGNSGCSVDREGYSLY